MTNNNGVKQLMDQKSKYINIIDGRRKTCYEPEKYDNIIYFFGTCITVGHLVEDKYTICSVLQDIINKNDIGYKVVNCGVWENVEKVLINFKNFKEGDCVIVYTGEEKINGFSNMSLEDIYVTHNIPLKWTDGCLHHCNHKVNEIVAKELFQMIESDLRSAYELENRAKCSIDIAKFIEEEYIKKYFKICDRKHNKGAIVMNCNPFTKGHRYLIEYASAKVEKLILFVVQENKSLFSFAERYEMVKEGVSDLENVMVVPSGNYILSQTTFPQYFGKVIDNEIEKI